MNPIREQKSEFREVLKRERKGLRRAVRLDYHQAILRNLNDLPVVSAADSVFCFVSRYDEVNTHSFIKSLLRSGKTVAVPKILPSKEMVAVKLQDWEQLEPGELGILSPVFSIPIAARPAICITPGLGFTAAGKRLGFGRGYYDKWFSQNPGILKIALAYECQILDDLPADENDVKMDMIITEQRIIQV